jgi:hypothetical protein
MALGTGKKILLVAVVTAVALGISSVAHAAAPLPQNPQSGSVGLSGQISAPPPTIAPTITTPTNGQTLTNIPVTVAGLCPQGTIVKIFKNGVFAGSAQCINKSFSLQIDLFSGRNDLIARASDALDQDGPDSATVTVTFNDARFGGTGSRIALTSNYVKRGANPGETLNWPIILTGGTGPYAISVDWGDGKPASLISREFPGVFDISHIYDNPGTYNIVVKATDKNGDVAYLQIIGVANGAVADNAATGITDKISNLCATAGIPPVIAGVGISLIAFLSFWLGSRYALLRLRKRLSSSSNEKY